MKQLSVIVPRDRTGLVERAFDQTAIAVVGIGQTTVVGLGSPPKLRHHGRSYEDARCVRLDAVVTEDQASDVAALLHASCGPAGYLLWSLPIDGMNPAVNEGVTTASMPSSSR